jgi:hypothetical protein
MVSLVVFSTDRRVQMRTIRKVFEFGDAYFLHCQGICVSGYECDAYVLLVLDV